jgi:hypothetical protein
MINVSGNITDRLKRLRRSLEPGRLTRPRLCITVYPIIDRPEAADSIRVWNELEHQKKILNFMRPSESRID